MLINWVSGTLSMSPRILGKRACFENEAAALIADGERLPSNSFAAAIMYVATVSTSPWRAQQTNLKDIIYFARVNYARERVSHDNYVQIRRREGHGQFVQRLVRKTKNVSQIILLCICFDFIVLTA